jgi:hypothetical protein
MLSSCDLEREREREKETWLSINGSIQHRLVLSTIYDWIQRRRAYHPSSKNMQLLLSHNKGLFVIQDTSYFLIGSCSKYFFCPLVLKSMCLDMLAIKFHTCPSYILHMSYPHGKALQAKKKRKRIQKTK